MRKVNICICIAHQHTNTHAQACTYTTRMHIHHTTHIHYTHWLSEIMCNLFSSLWILISILDLMEVLPYLTLPNQAICTHSLKRPYVHFGTFEKMVLLQNPS